MTARQETSFTVDQGSKRLSADVRAALPKLSAQSKKWGRSTICPTCGGPKVTEARNCLDCHKYRKKIARSGALAISVPDDGPKGSFRTRGSEGHPVAQPKRPIMVKRPDGTWERQA